MEVDTERELSSAEQVIYGISQMILDGKLKIGGKLPPERDMIDLFKVGRPAVREGLCALQIAGLIDAKPLFQVYNVNYADPRLMTYAYSMPRLLGNTK